MTQRCQELWGPGEMGVNARNGISSGVAITSARLTSAGPTGARVADDTCFTYSIPPGCNGRILPSVGG
jgi:hypothetical protein